MSNESIPLEPRAPPCWRCGQDALLACCDCKEARYCSEACQKEDWLDGGHKQLCQGPPSAIKSHVILRQLFVAEFEWLKSLDDDDKTKLFNEDFRQHPINHLVLSGEVALVLARAHPSALLSNIRNQHSYRFGRVFFEQVISPWYEAHQEFLNQEGFFVEFLNHDVHLADCPCTCVRDGVPCGKLGTQSIGAALVKDVRNPKIALVEKVFTVPRSPFLEKWEEEQMVKWEDMMDCISFRKPLEPFDEQGTNTEYAYAYTGQIFGREEVCCSPCLVLRFEPVPKDAIALGLHFGKARRAMAAIGFDIGMDMRNQEAWPDNAIGKVWFAAAAGDINTFSSWLENDASALPFLVRVDEDRYHNIVRSVFQRCLPAE